MRLLVVDDDISVSMMVTIDDPDVTTIESNRVREGYELAVEERPDAIVIDRRLPDGDGLDLVRQLRVNGRTHRTPIIVLTASHDPADEPDVLRAGADAYLPKPYEPAVLMRYVRAVANVPAGERKHRRMKLASSLEAGLRVDEMLDFGDDDRRG